MSLNWDWNKKCGTLVAECDTRDGGKVMHTFNMYKGNAMLIVLDECDDKYSLYSFLADKDHLKNLLGMNAKQGYSKENIIAEWGWKKMRINVNKYDSHKELMDMVDLLVKGLPELTIELYREE